MNSPHTHLFQSRIHRAAIEDLVRDVFVRDEDATREITYATRDALPSVSAIGGNIPSGVGVTIRGALMPFDTLQFPEGGPGWSEASIAAIFVSKEELTVRSITPKANDYFAVDGQVYEVTHISSDPLELTFIITGRTNN